MKRKEQNECVRRGFQHDERWSEGTERRREPWVGFDGEFRVFNDDWSICPVLRREWHYRRSEEEPGDAGGLVMRLDDCMSDRKRSIYIRNRRWNEWQVERFSSAGYGKKHSTFK